MTQLPFVPMKIPPRLDRNLLTKILGVGCTGVDDMNVLWMGYESYDGYVVVWTQRRQREEDKMNMDDPMS